MSTTRPRVPSEVAHECLEGVLVRALENNATVPEVVLPDKSTTARIVQVLQPEEDATHLASFRVPQVLKTLDHVRHIDNKPRRRPPKRKSPVGKGSKKSHANSQVTRRGKETNCYIIHYKVLILFSYINIRGMF